MYFQHRCGDFQKDAGSVYRKLKGVQRHSQGAPEIRSIIRIRKKHSHFLVHENLDVWCFRIDELMRRLFPDLSIVLIKFPIEYVLNNLLGRIDVASVVFVVNDDFDHNVFLKMPIAFFEV